MASDLSAAHARLLSELVRQREGASMSQAALAARLGWSQSRVARLETGERKPRQADVTEWLTSFGVPVELLTEMIELAHEVSVESKQWGSLYRAAGSAGARQEKYADLNRVATSIAIFQPAVIPGLAQTAEYARRVAQLMPVARDQIAGMVAAKMARQDVLYEAGKDVTLLVTEAALRLMVAPPAVMVGQVDRLASLASLANVRVGIVPVDVAAPALPLSAFVLRDFPDGTASVFVETLTAEVEVTDPGAVALYRDALTAWLKVAVVGAAASHLLAEVRERFASRP